MTRSVNNLVITDDVAAILDWYVKECQELRYLLLRAQSHLEDGPAGDEIFIAINAAIGRGEKK